MSFNSSLRPHKELRDKHAFLSPSSYHWLNYNEEKLEKTYLAMMRKEQGTRLHALAKELIELGVMLPETNETLNMYVNDCIICHMVPEQPLFYSWNCFGTADAIGFDGNTLRIFDLKTGVNVAKMEQLKIYAALFFLEYGNEFMIKPTDVDIELRIYQSGKVDILMPDASEVRDIMNHIVLCDDQIHRIEGERGWNNAY